MESRWTNLQVMSWILNKSITQFIPDSEAHWRDWGDDVAMFKPALARLCQQFESEHVSTKGIKCSRGKFSLLTERLLELVGAYILCTREAWMSACSAYSLCYYILCLKVCNMPSLCSVYAIHVALKLIVPKEEHTEELSSVWVYVFLCITIIIAAGLHCAVCRALICS